MECSGEPAEGSAYPLFFGEGYDWQAKVITVEPGVSFHMKMTLFGPDLQLIHLALICNNMRMAFGWSFGIGTVQGEINTFGDHLFGGQSC